MIERMIPILPVSVAVMLIVFIAMGVDLIGGLNKAKARGELRS